MTLLTRRNPQQAVSTAQRMWVEWKTSFANAIIEWSPGADHSWASAGRANVQVIGNAFASIIAAREHIEPIVQEWKRRIEERDFRHDDVSAWICRNANPIAIGAGPVLGGALEGYYALFGDDCFTEEDVQKMYDRMSAILATLNAAPEQLYDVLNHVSAEDTGQPPGPDATDLANQAMGATGELAQLWQGWVGFVQQNFPGFDPALLAMLLVIGGVLLISLLFGRKSNAS